MSVTSNENKVALNNPEKRFEQDELKLFAPGHEFNRIVQNQKGIDLRSSCSTELRTK